MRAYDAEPDRSTRLVGRLAQSQHLTLPQPHSGDPDVATNYDQHLATGLVR